MRHFLKCLADFLRLLHSLHKSNVPREHDGPSPCTEREWIRPKFAAWGNSHLPAPGDFSKKFRPTMEVSEMFLDSCL